MENETLLAEATVADKASHTQHTCDNYHDKLLAIADAMDVLNGKWKIQVIGCLLFKGKMRFGELLRSVDGIGAKMLSKELQTLEANQIITRTVLQTKPITVEYEITEYGKTLEETISTIVMWGTNHRKQIMG
jgi:DNA-binding HxlR family transcriptional regulator